MPFSELLLDPALTPNKVGIAWAYPGVCDEPMLEAVTLCCLRRLHYGAVSTLNAGADYARGWLCSGCGKGVFRDIEETFHKSICEIADYPGAEADVEAFVLGWSGLPLELLDIRLEFVG